MVYPVIMAGGIGKRFWPMSTPKKPKQFLTLLDRRKTMLELTIDRFSKIFGRRHIWMVSSHRFLPYLYKTASSIERSHWLLEPQMRNTAPGMGWAAITLLHRDPNAIMLISPSDHWITGEKEFQADLKAAIQFVERKPEALVTFGMKPVSAETGYGYIERAQKISKHIFVVKRFIEKPHLSLAKKLISKKSYLWNTGLFIWRADTILNEIKKHLPSLYQGLQGINSKNLKKRYKSFPNISIDYSILEKSRSVYVLESSFQWSDVGNWKSLSHLRPSRTKRWISIDSKNCFVDAENKEVTTVGVSDLIVVDHPNGLLICHQDASERVKER